MSKIKGFTLIELMVVIAIISILFAIAIPIYSNYTQKTHDTACLLEMKAYASLYLLEKSMENGSVLNLPLASALNHCAFTAPSDFLAVTLIATVPKGSGKSITCDVNEKAVCNIY